MKRRCSRKLSLQTLEHRIAMSSSDLFDISGLPIEPTYTTFDAPANHVTARGNQFDGVVQLTIQRTVGQNQFTVLGSGTLLPNGTHILTAAHNFTDVFQNPIPTVTNVTATFELPGGNVVVPLN